MIKMSKVFGVELFQKYIFVQIHNYTLHQITCTHDPHQRTYINRQSPLQYIVV